MSRTLCIIDMQEEFNAATDPDTIQGVCVQIRRAKRYDWPVLLLEYGSSETYPHKRSLHQLRGLLKGYEKYHRVIKHDDDGGDKVIAAAAKYKFDISTIRVCGVNADCCVQETVYGILKQIPKTRIELVHNGCNSDGAANHQDVLDDLQYIKGRRRNVRII